MCVCVCVCVCVKTGVLHSQERIIDAWTFVLECALIWVLVGVPQNLCIIIIIIIAIIIFIFNCITMLLPDYLLWFFLKLMLFLFLP
jgi:hypothetical protein